MKNIIRACSYVTGVDSPGMRNLKAYHTELTDKQIEALDALNVNQGIDCQTVVPLMLERLRKYCYLFMNTYSLTP